MDEYEIGYKKPPSKSRFKKGASGNPKGRPKGKRIFTPTESLDQYLMEKIWIQEGGKQREVTKLEAFQKRLLMEAINGDKFAMKMLQKFLGDIEKYRKTKQEVSTLPTEIQITFVSPDGRKMSQKEMSEEVFNYDNEEYLN